MQISRATGRNGLRRMVTVGVAFAVLLTGLLGAASAAPSGAPSAPQETAASVVIKRTAHVTSDIARPPGTQAVLSFRLLWCGISGDAHLNVTGTGAYNGQPVAVTVVQAGTGSSEFFGAARMRVNNVSVWNGNVTAWVTVEWGEPLCIWTHYIAI